VAQPAAKASDAAIYPSEYLAEIARIRATRARDQRDQLLRSYGALAGALLNAAGERLKARVFCVPNRGSGFHASGRLGVDTHSDRHTAARARNELAPASAIRLPRAEIDRMRPRLPPTGRKVARSRSWGSCVSAATRCTTILTCWDQASVRAQIDPLEVGDLLVAGVETARKLLDVSLS
jgi:hypothetical protein